MEATYYVVTHLNTAPSFAKMLRGRLNRAWARGVETSIDSVSVRGDAVIILSRSRPWGVLAGYMTNRTQVIPCRDEDAAEALVRE